MIASHCAMTIDRYSNFTKSGGEAYLFSQSQVAVPVEEYKAAVIVSAIALTHPSQHSESFLFMLHGFAAVVLRSFSVNI